MGEENKIKEPVLKSLLAMKLAEDWGNANSSPAAPQARPLDKKGNIQKTQPTPGPSQRKVKSVQVREEDYEEAITSFSEFDKKREAAGVSEDDYKEAFQVLSTIVNDTEHSQDLTKNVSDSLREAPRTNTEASRQGEFSNGDDDSEKSEDDNGDVRDLSGYSLKEILDYKKAQLLKNKSIQALIQNALTNTKAKSPPHGDKK